MICFSCDKKAIDIQSYILRDRVVVTDRILMKKALYVSFSIKGNPSEQRNIKANGRLLIDGEIFSESSIGFSSDVSGNVVFDLPGRIPDGLYTIEIHAFDDKGTWVAKDSKTIEREEMKSSFEDKVKPDTSAFEEVPFPVESHDFAPTDKDKSIGYITFVRSPLEYIFPGSRPGHSEVIESLSIRVAGNEFEPITFSLYPIQDLGMVRVSIDDLKGTDNFISNDNVEIAFVESVEDTSGLPLGKFRMFPKMIKPGSRVKVESGESRRFWLTIRVDKNVAPGVYTGRITISPQYGKETSVPLKVTVVPITLEDIPCIDYFMLMTYEFTELSMPWTREEREKIYDSACNVLKDYREF